MLINFTAASMHSGILIIHFRGMQLGHLSSQAARVKSINTRVKDREKTSVMLVFERRTPKS